MSRNCSRFLFAAALALAAAGAVGCGSEVNSTQAAEAPAPLPAVSVIRVAPSDVESAIEISGNLAPQARVNVFSKVPGTIDKVFVKLGDRVGLDAPLAAMDRRDIDAQLDQAVAAVNVARAGLAAAEAALANAQLEVDRARNLFEKGALPKQRLEAADTAFRSAEAQRDLGKANVAQAEAAARRAREVQRDAMLRAPVAGVIVERNFDPGNLVGPSGTKPVVAVADMRALKLEAGVSELDAGRLKVGMPARVTLPAKQGQVFEGRLVALAPEVDPRNRHFQIEIRVDNRDQQLLGGMYAVARLVVDRASAAIALPREAVFSRAGGRNVYRIDGNQVSIVRVTEGLSDGARVQITSGLKAGDVVVADARRDVTEGARVRPIPAN
jgi:RND family efflux transporter MFP subunit